MQETSQITHNEGYYLFFILLRLLCGVNVQYDDIRLHVAQSYTLTVATKVADQGMRNISLYIRVKRI